MYKNLLVPIDGTHIADKAMNGSIELAKQLGATITAFVAEPAPPLPAVGRQSSSIMKESVVHDAISAKHAQEVLSCFEALARDAGIGFSGHHIQADRVDDAIVNAAEEHGCDMIVMATHGRGVFGELMLGSHTKGVMARSKLPLLVLHW